MRESPNGQQSDDGEVFIQLWPVNANATTNQATLRAGRGRGIAEPRKPLERYGELASIRQADGEDIIGAVNFHRPWFGIKRRRTHANAPRRARGAAAQAGAVRPVQRFGILQY